MYIYTLKMNYSEEYNKNGYLILENLYTSTEVDEIKEIVKNLKIDDFEHSKDKTGYPFRITNILPKNKNLKRIIEKPEILKILKECMGDDVVFFKDKYISKKKIVEENLYLILMEPLSLITIG